jgi:hypothetical protein
MSFAVITPTIGTKHLARCIESLRGQDCTHHLFVDGRTHWWEVQEVLDNLKWDGLQLAINQIDQNIGKGYYGHRVYAASPFLVNQDVLCFLDEDNWAAPDYIEAFQEVLKDTKYSWAHTLRNVVSPTGEFICRDDCENLGQWPVMLHSDRYHIDTGCFAVPRSLALQVSHAWYGQWGADRMFFSVLKQAAPHFGCTNKYTLNYRLGSETNMATQEMFLQGNKLVEEHYRGKYPWHTQRTPTKIPAKTLVYRTTN